MTRSESSTSLLLASLLVFALALAIVPAAPAQTPAATVKDDGGNVVFRSFVDGGLLAPGEITVGSIPAEGPGTRLMWYPRKAAFRAGRVGDNLDGSQWNDGKIGRSSVAFGVDTKASARAATAMGQETTASGIQSTAMGEETVASNRRAVASGFKSEAGGRDAVAMGHQTTASGKYAVAMGQNTKATKGDATALGDATEASGSDAFAVGLESVASGTQAIAIGGGAKASDSDAVALGNETTANSTAATAMGFKTTASDQSATAMGRKTEAGELYSTAMGIQSTGNGVGATAMGVSTIAKGQGTLAVGQCNSTTGPSGITVGDATGALFVVGSGSYNFPSDGKCEAREDAFVVDADGNARANSHTSLSDRRLKTDIDPLSEGVLGALGEIDPVRYRFKNEQTHPSGEQIGLIAQDVRKEFPELVSTGSDGMLSLAYPKLTAVLLKGLQEQQSTIEEQKGRIAALETQTDEQSRKIAALKAENEEIKDRLAALETSSSSALSAGLGGSWALALLMGLGGLGAGLLGVGLLALRRL